jgi:AcrR family transcriptional regulator
MLAEDIERATADWHDLPEEAVAAMGAAYVRFAIDHPGRFRLMFGRDLKNRRDYPELVNATEEISERIGRILRSPPLGLAVWAAMHGLAWLLVEEVADLGSQDESQIPARAEIVLRALLANIAEA